MTEPQDMMTEDPATAGVMEEEPAVALGAAMTAFAQALFTIMRASGLPLTEEMSGGIIMLIHAILMFPLFAGVLIRFFVFSPKSYLQGVQTAYEAAAEGEAVVR